MPEYESPSESSDSSDGKSTDSTDSVNVHGPRVQAAPAFVPLHVFAPVAQLAQTIAGNPSNMYLDPPMCKHPDCPYSRHQDPMYQRYVLLQRLYQLNAMLAFKHPERKNAIDRVGML